MGEPTAFERLEKVAQELYGDLDLTDQYRFHGDKTQWNHHIQANLVSLLNDVLMVSPRWMGRGGKAGFTAHALFLAARIELAMMQDPPAEVLAALEKMEAEVRTARTLEQIRKDESMLNDLERNFRDVTLETLPGLLQTARMIATNGATDGHKRRAKVLVSDMENRLK